ncbi:Uncharacterized protein Adt_11543 [Abeliophyllum distichum]|uniref:Uncharacterized protein n=1 Tax=Abeliophyllum distichum TaxID=126358 RepID=A0ABD1UN88_9LAMI
MSYAAIVLPPESNGNIIQQKASPANIENRSKKKYNHHTGSRRLSYMVEEMTVDEMLAKDSEYLAERTNEQQFFEDTPLEEILGDNQDVGLKIMMSMLRVKLRRQIR